MELTIYPAIDLRGGQVVRLKLGDPQRQTVFNDDPAATAQRWVRDGAQWLHVVNLDGAFDEAGLANWQALPAIAASGARVQFGGGIRTISDAERAFASGAERVVLGTVAVEHPELVAQVILQFGPERIAVGIDARDGRVRTRGWQREASQTPSDLATEMRNLGVRTIIYTDINRDGILTGVSAAATADLARRSGLEVIASGGVAGLEDVRQVAATTSDGVRGLIIGRALYDERLSLPDALTIARSVGATSTKTEDLDAG